MGKVYKSGRVVIVLSGCYAGKKALVIKNMDEGSSDRSYEHALIAGIARYPRPVSRRMRPKVIERRCRIKPFVKLINLKHLMPTRYSVSDIPIEKSIVTKDCIKDPTKKRKARLHVKNVFEERYKSGKNRWFFEKLHF
ncbi:60S ribosomal protein L27 [Hyalella azteca]|uniref:60S ribosomal protein L27 n=1 Tax=Hyalella azteca TaxID=294128 RepID=A0A8B7PD20_HYAAZ|nr:60S ribosomal protein L27 [Hyalella azteca]